MPSGLKSQLFHSVVKASPKSLIPVYLRMSDIFLHMANHVAVKVNGGIHPKHEIMQYYRFFTRFLTQSSRVLDVGSKEGALTSKLAAHVGHVTGIELNAKNVAEAKRLFPHLKNVEFIHGDVVTHPFREKFDACVMSNVLEHIENRIEVLRKLRELTPILMIRVPAIDRDWWPLYRKKLGIEWRSDPTHYIEYTEEVLREELARGGWALEVLETRWGELYVKCVHE